MSEPETNAEAPLSEDDEGLYADWGGRIFDERYRIGRLLGVGGMGAVFEAEHLKLEKRVAVKVIHPRFAGNGEVAERFAREMLASARVDHPNIASAIDCGVVPDGGAYLVLQLAKGTPLRDTLDERGGLGWLRACEVVAQVADAVASAHAEGIIHRDLKPDNVMIEEREDQTTFAMVLDFGVARMLGSDPSGEGAGALTRVGTIVGTPGYMAPEQALGEPLDFRADIYALGVILYEAATGEKLYPTRDLTAIVTRQLTEEPPRLSERLSVPPELDVLVARALQRESAARPASAAEVRDQLRAIALEAAVRAYESGETVRPPSGAAALLQAGRVSAPVELHEATGTPEKRVGGARKGASEPTVADVETAPPRPQAARSRPNSSKLPLVVLLTGAVFACAGIGALLLTLSSEPPMGAKREHDIAEDGAPPGAPVPAALLESFEEVRLGRTQRGRREAARAILAHEPRRAVPELLVGLAHLELARSCAPRRRAVVRLGELGDPRALPSLERLSAEPRNGCRRGFRRSDCWGCLRQQLSDAIEGLPPGE